MEDRPYPLAYRPRVRTLRHRLEAAHSVAEAALVKARRRVRMDEER